jgi:Ca-activated chloride channel family protein
MKTACPTAWRWLVLLVPATVAVLSLAGLAQAAEPPTTVVIFDGSGSMWGKLDGERSSKLVMARDAVRKGLARTAPGTLVGLMSFGHRRGGDCQDTETLIKPAPLDIERVMAPLETLNPRGRGPLTKALREAGALLGAKSAPASIVLLHDGPDNCEQDPCTVIGELKQAHPDVRVSVVSIGLSAEDARGMACLPQETGGQHYQVANTAEITAALDEALATRATPPPTAPQPPPPAPVTKAPPAPPGRPGLQLSAMLTKGAPAVALPVHWEIRRAGEKGAPLWEGTTPAPLLVLPTGRYDIDVRSGLIAQHVVAEAVEGEARALGVVLEAGTLALAEGTTGARTLDGTVVSLARIEGAGTPKSVILQHIEPEIALAPGTYLVSVTAGTLRIERPVGIVAGQRVTLAGSLALGTVELSALTAKGGKGVDRIVYSVLEDDPDAPQGRREIARSAAPTPSFRLPAGTYYVVARAGMAEARERISVRAAETQRHQLVLDAAQLDLSVRVAGGRLTGEGPITHAIERLGGASPETVSGNGASASFDLGAGRYRLVTRVGLGNVAAERELKLSPGQTEHIDVDLTAGAVRLRLLDGASGTPIVDAGWEIRDASGRVVWTGLGTEARALLFAGRYMAKAEARGLAREKAFEVRAGEERAIDLSR